MSKWRHAVIVALLGPIFHPLHGQEVPAPKLKPPSGELTCPATIRVTEEFPNAIVVLTTDGTQPSTNDARVALLSIDTVRNEVLVPIRNTTTIRAIAVARADLGPEAPYRVSAESAATYTCANLSNSQSTDRVDKPSMPNHEVASPQPGSTYDKARTSESVTDAHVRSRWFWPLVAGGAILLSVALALLALHLTQLRRVGREVFPSLTRLKITSATIQDGLRAVDLRTRELRLFFQTFDDESGASFELLDIPPGLRGVERRRFAREDPARFWHASRLSFELEDNAYLLLERVTDAVVSFARAGALRNSALPSAIQLEQSRASEQKFPWRVVITSRDPETLHALLSNPETSKWCGIDIEIRRPRREAVTQGRCRVGSDGLEGVIGGVFEDARSGERYGVTCAHVLSSTCPVSVSPGGKPVVAPKEHTAEQPDVAFIRDFAACFNRPLTQEKEVLVATSKDIVTYLENETSLRKTPSNDGVVGIVQQGLGSLFRLGDVTYRGPHFVIAPKFYKQFGLTLPFSRRFSSPGDSGCWVTTEEGTWLGMIVGAFSQPNTTSLAIHGQHLLNAFSRSQSTSAPRSTIRTKVNYEV